MPTKAGTLHKAHEYELSAEAYREREDLLAEVAWYTVAVTLREVALALEEVELEGDAA
jgi:hypothetical protein